LRAFFRACSVAGRPLADAMAILGAMGLPPARAEQALLKARNAEPELTEDLQVWVRLALQQL
jgi:hypothetical protein